MLASNLTECLKCNLEATFSLISHCFIFLFLTSILLPNWQLSAAEIFLP